MREIGGNPNFTPPNSPICILGKRICSKMGVPFMAIWVNHGYTAKREMSEEIRVSPTIFLTGNALGGGVRVLLTRDATVKKDIVAMAQLTFSFY